MRKPSYTWEDLVNEVYPGLLAEIRVSGKATYQEDEDGFDYYEVGQAATAVLAFRYVYEPDRTLLRFKITASRVGKAPWKVEMFNWHCGPNPYDHEETHFRVDRHPIRADQRPPYELHAHIEGVADSHLHPDEVEPDIRKLTPVDFVKMVAKYRQDKKCPLVRKGTRK